MIKLVTLLYLISSQLHYKAVFCEEVEEFYNNKNGDPHQQLIPCYYQNDTTLCLSYEGESKCGYTLNSILWCDDGRLVIMNRYCATYNEDKESFELGKCIYGNILPRGEIYYKRVLEKYSHALQKKCMQVFNRDDTLCGKCRNGTYLLTYSYEMNCVECPDRRKNWWKFVLAAFLPMTFFCFIVLFFRINATSSHLHGFIFFTQFAFMPLILQTAFISLHHGQGKLWLISRLVVIALYGIWNLDFFRSFPFGICLGTNNILLILALDIAVGMYPLLLMYLTYLMINLYDRNFTPLVLMWKPFKALFGIFLRNVDIRTSLIDSFATFSLLSNMKFLSASFALLTPVRVYQVPLSDPFNVTVSWRLFYDATIHYVDRTHLPYAVLATVVLVLLVLFPMLVLVLYPFRWFQKLLNILPIRLHILHTFVDTFLGCYKDGTEPGTRDCRWFAAIFLLIRPLLFLIWSYTLDETYCSIYAVLLSIVIIAIINIEPFKNKNGHNANFTNAIFLLLLDIWCMIGTEFDSVAPFHQYNTQVCTLAGATMLLITLIYISAVTIRWILSDRKCGSRIVRQFYAWRHGYKLLE